MTEQPSPPTAPGAGDGDVRIDPAMVVTRVQQSGETGNALVRAAMGQLFAEHYAAENAALREELAAARAQLAGDESGPPA